MSKVNKKVVIITGASSGIGKACSQTFAEYGFDIVLTSRNQESLNEIAGELKTTGANVLVVQADVSVEEQCELVINQTLKEFGQIDVLINNAGVSMRALFTDVNLNVIRKVMDINFWGTVYCTKFALPHLLKSKGSIIGISSVAGKKGLPGRTGYSASKFAMEGFLECIRIENRKNDLHVLIACPGFTNTKIRESAFTKDGSQQGESPRDEAGMMTPEEVAEKIFRAYKNRKREIIMTTQGKLTVLLNKYFPAWMDRVVYNHMAKEADSPF